jgi:hypothetical protein
MQKNIIVLWNICFVVGGFISKFESHQSTQGTPQSEQNLEITFKFQNFRFIEKLLSS